LLVNDDGPRGVSFENGQSYVVEGEVEIAGETFEGPRLLVFHPVDQITVRATRPARLMFLGGAALEGPRYIWWNFVSSRRERIEQAKEDWKMMIPFCLRSADSSVRTRWAASC
jgi:redox-sensitive bicupin YhaK (pirin superfamily)